VEYEHAAGVRHRAEGRPLEVADVLDQLDEARSNAADEEIDLRVAIVVFDARRTCEIRLDRSNANRAGTLLVGLEDLDDLREPHA